MANDSNDPLFDSEPPGMLARILPPLVLICAFGSFVSLAIYAYKAGTQPAGDGELAVIEADKTPMKEKPEDPGGMQFPNQDKTIFETFSGSRQAAQVERVLPTPEEPITPAKEAAADWANGKLAGGNLPPAVAPSAGSEQLFADDDAAPKVVKVQDEMAKQDTSPAAPAPEETTATKPVDLTPINVANAVKEPANLQVKVVPEADVAATEVTLVEKPEAPKEAVIKEETKKPEPKKAGQKPKAGSGKQIVQLGAYKSDAEARADYTKMQKKHAALSGRSPIVNRADLGDKGVFFRLRVATEDAKKLCASLSGQACMVVK